MAVRFARLKKVLTKLLCSSLSGSVIGLVTRNRIPFRGARIKVDSTNVRHATKARLFLGIYESAECRFVKKYLRRDVPTVELGASLGAVSSQISQVLADGVRYVCVEANPNLIPLLSENVDRNSTHLDRSVVTGAVCYGGETVEFRVSNDNRISSLQGEGNGRAVTVKSVRLSEIAPEQPYQLVCDIEGAEADLLANDSQTLERCQLAIVELHTAELNGHRLLVSDLVEQFEQMGLKQIEHYGDVFVFRRQENC